MTWSPDGSADLNTGHAHRVLVCGAARSGTTWVAQCLGRSADASYVHEPDNYDWVPFAARARAGLGILPVLDRGDEAPALYERLWEAAFSTRGRSNLDRLATKLYARVPGPTKSAVLSPVEGRTSRRLPLAVRLARPHYAEVGSLHRVVKSVNVALSLEWIVERFEPRVLVVRRNPLDVIASRLSFGSAFLQNVLGFIDERGVADRLERWDAPQRPTSDDRFAHFVWFAGFTLSAFDETARANPHFQVIDYEDVSADPIPRFRRIVADLGLEWRPACEEFLASSNTDGTGYDTRRVSTRQVGRWRESLSGEQLDVAREVLVRFPIARLYPDLFA